MTDHTDKIIVSTIIKFSYSLVFVFSIIGHFLSRSIETSLIFGLFTTLSITFALKDVYNIQ